MITAIATLLIAQAPATPTPAGLASKMFARYAAAESLSGTVMFEQSGGGVVAKFRTDVQYERPYRLYIRQERLGRKEVSMTVADGRMFTYEMPEGSSRRVGDRLYELQNQRGVVYNIADIFTIAQPGLLDKSPALDVLIAKTQHLSYFRSQLASLGWKRGVAPTKSESGVIVGNWRAYGTAPVSGTYELKISPAGDLLSYIVRENLAVPGAKPIAVTSEWTVSVNVGDPGDKTKFRVVKP